jgi:hypothetical protein
MRLESSTGNASDWYFDTAQAILQATIDDDLPDLERAIHTLDRSLADQDPPGDVTPR